MTERIHWPSWRYGPQGQAEIFDHAEQVPDGWVDHPSLLGHGPESHPATDITNSAATDPTLGGDPDSNRGTPATHDQQGATQGGEVGQTTDNTNLFSLPPVDEVDKTWVCAQLNTRKVPHNPRWRLQKLYDLLHDVVSPAQD